MALPASGPSVAFYLLVGVQAVSGLLSMLLILLHSPKSDGLGGGLTQGVSQLFQSQKGAESTLNKITGWCLGVFLVSSFVMGYQLIP